VDANKKCPGTWGDIDIDRKEFKVRDKPGFTSKDKKEEGGIPVPDYFIDLMRARRQRYPRSASSLGSTENLTGISSAYCNVLPSALA
jgi:hypothetical protein